MSFILDALKKSEAERQRQHAPGIASIPESHTGRYLAEAMREAARQSLATS